MSGLIALKLLIQGIDLLHVMLLHRSQATRLILLRNSSVPRGALPSLILAPAPCYNLLFLSSLPLTVLLSAAAKSRT